MAKYPRQPRKVSLCDKVAEVFVQIPPALFDGLESLAWPIPLGLCATIGKKFAFASSYIWMFPLLSSVFLLVSLGVFSRTL